VHLVAEEGVAAHVSYKGVIHTGDFDKKLNWMRELLDQQSASNSEFLENAKIDFFSEKMYVFTPKGKIIELPSLATSLDFAYAIHSGLGETAMGANINGKFVSLKAELKNGDVVEIITSKHQHPTRDWLKIAKTYKAKTKIRQYLKQHGEVVANVQKSLTESPEQITKDFIVVYGAKDSDVKLSKCCNPLPGEKILGYKSGLKKITIHNASCPTIKTVKSDSKKQVKAEWKESFNSDIRFYVDGEDRLGFFAEILNTISSRGYNILDAKGKSLKDGSAECIFRMNLTSLTELIDLISRLKKINGVKRVIVETIAEKKKKRRLK
jgi:GTP pyrophosphokinase